MVCIQYSHQMVCIQYSMLTLSHRCFQALPNSRHLSQEMRHIAEGQVTQVSLTRNHDLAHQAVLAAVNITSALQSFYKHIAVDVSDIHTQTYTQVYIHKHSSSPTHIYIYIGVHCIGSHTLLTHSRAPWLRASLGPSASPSP